GTALTAGISSNVSKTGLATGANDALVAGDMVINGVAVGASSASADTASTAQAASSSISKAAAINAVSAQTGVTATVNENSVEGTNVAAASAIAATDVSINGTTFSLGMAAGGTVSDALGTIAETINSKADATGVTASVVETSTGARIDLTSADGRNINIVDTAGTQAAALGLATGAATTGLTYVGDY